MKILGITQRVDTIAAYQENRDALDQRWVPFLQACGFILLPLPNHLLTVKKILQQIPLSGVILSGGNQTAARDEVEIFLIQRALAGTLPLLGVCHGMQMIQRFFGITLQPVSQHVMAEQTIFIEDKEMLVNSYHTEGTAVCELPLKTWAIAKDGIIKAIKHTSAPLHGIMWHPERIQPFAARDINLIKNLFKGFL